MENKLDKITDLTEKKPTQALIYAMGTVIVVLAFTVIPFLFFKIGAKETEGIEAVKAQRATDMEEIAFWKVQYKDMKKEKDDCNNLVVVRTDQNAIKDKERLDFLEESFQKSIVSRKKQAVSIKKLTDAIPTVKTPTINPINQSNEN